MTPNLQYPVAPRDDTVVDEFKSGNGSTVKIADPFRPLEDPHAEHTKKWINEQIDLFNNKYFNDQDRELRGKLLEKLLASQDYPKIFCPSRRNHRLFLYRNDGLQNQNVLYMTDYSVDNEKCVRDTKVLLDPNTLSSDGTTSVKFTSFSDDGKYVAYGVSYASSDWTTILVRDVESGTDLPQDKLRFCKFTSVGWLPNNTGFFYCRYPEPSSAAKESAAADVEGENSALGTETDRVERQRVYFHRIGDSQDQDQLVYCDDEHPQWMFGAQVTDDGKYLIITVSESTAHVNRFYYAELSEQPQQQDYTKLNIIKLIDNFDAEYDYIANDGTLFYVKTNLNAPNSKLVRIDLAQAARNGGKVEPIDHVPEQQDHLNYALVVADNKLIMCYTHDAHELLQLFDLESGKLVRDVPLPGIGSIDSIHGRREHRELFYRYVSFVTPGTIYRLNLDTNETSVFYQVKLPVDVSDLETRQVFFDSKPDGTRVPMFITCRRDFNPQTAADAVPCILYGYGGFTISFTPYFSMLKLLFVKLFGGVYALANIRGGGEYGERWHEAGIKSKKQNVFNDFISAAEYLIDKGYTSQRLLTIEGGSNGGLLTAACALQRPELFGCVLSHVGVHDMLRFHKFTIGYAWTSDYGCADVPEEFDALVAYSPLHNVRPGLELPSFLVLTSDHDDRVVPLHSFKFAATLQHVRADNKKPLVMRIESKAGHGAGTALRKVLEQYADIFTFIAKEQNLKVNAL